MSFAVPRIGRSTLAALAAGGALASLAVAPSAQAAFSLQPCAGSAIAGVGATFQNNAHQKANGWAIKFRSTATASSCPGGPVVDYNAPGVAPTGSGAGRAAMGGATDAAARQRNVQFRFAGSDEGPTVEQQQNMDTGILGNSADDGRIHVIPAAASAVAVVVNYPKWDHDGASGTAAVSCPLPDGFRADGTHGGASADGYDRLRLTNAQLENLWAGTYATWGDLIPSLATDRAASGNPSAYAASCVDKKIIRVVRNDTSGTTFAFKDFLAEAVAGLGTGAGKSSGTAWRNDWLSGDFNRRWPATTADDDHTSGELANLYGEIANGSNVCDPADIAAAPKPVCRPGTTGASALAAVVTENPGSVGYLDLATAVTNNFTKDDTAADTTYFLPLAVKDSTTNFIEATFNPEGYKKNVSTGGANCRDVPVRKLPVASDPTLAYGWDKVTMVWPSAGYSDCSLTYILAFDDNAPVYLSLPGTTYAEEERKARTLKDYLTYILTDAGQSALIDLDYAPLPKTVAPGEADGTKSAWDAARTGVAAIDWDKAGIGNQGGGKPPVDSGNPPAPGGGTTPGTTPPVVAPPTTQAPVNLFTIGSSRKKGSDLLASFRLPGAGRLSVTATGSYTEKVKRKGKKAASRKRSVSVGKATVGVTRAGDLSVKLPMSSKARSALKKAKRITVKITAVYTPTGGTARTITRTLTLRA